MEYLNKTFSVGVGSKDYRDGWDRIFGKKQEAAHEIEEVSPPTTEEKESPCPKENSP